MMIIDYPNHRRRNCETGVLANMLEWYGMNLSEEMIFGIGSGLYFMYSPILAVEGTCYPLMRLQPVEMVKRVAERLKLDIRVKSFGENKRRATAVLDRMVSRDIPVGVVLNVKGLSYFNVSGMESDFNGHIVTIIGMDDNDYIVAETDSRLATDEYFRIGKEMISDIRFSPGIGAPHGKIFWMASPVDSPSIDGRLKEATVLGLEESCNKFLRVILPHYGVKGLHYFANDLRTWEKRFNSREISYKLMWYYRLIERAGTGGSGYRYIYRDFLKEASQLFESEVLDDCAKMMNLSAEHWRLFNVEGRRFIKSKDVEVLLGMADIIDQIGEYEYETFSKIQKEFLSQRK